jgi:hypothetical protein
MGWRVETKYVIDGDGGYYVTRDGYTETVTVTNGRSYDSNDSILLTEDEARSLRDVLTEILGED